MELFGFCNNTSRDLLWPPGSSINKKQSSLHGSNHICCHNADPERMTAEAGPSIPVFLLAQNRLLRESLCRVLDKRNGIHIVGAASRSTEALQAIAVAKPRVLLSDLRDSFSNLQFSRTLRTTLPSLRVVMIGMEASQQLFIQAVREGVAGYVLRDATSAQLIDAVRAVADGWAICPPELCRALFDHIAATRGRGRSSKRCSLWLTHQDHRATMADPNL
jgi:DNA-binding NarL/FixJ family response regulator